MNHTDHAFIRKIGIDGGHSTYELGPASDVELFFECLDVFVARAKPIRDWSLLTDRFYRRHLRHEELAESESLMKDAHSIFATIATSAIDWSAHSNEGSQSELDRSYPSLATLFASYFEKFSAAVRSAESFFEAFRIYKPVRLVISDLPGFARDKKRPLADYDAPMEKPFWLQ